MTDAYHKLKERIADKQISIARKEEEMKEQLNEIGRSLTPGALVKSAVRNVTGGRVPSGLVSTGLTMGVSFLADRLLFRKRNTLIRGIGMFAVRKLVNKFTKR